MRIAFLDGSLCKNREEFHFQIKEKLEFPDYYGMNLDAMFDCLSTMNETKVYFLHWRVFVETLGDYGHSVIQTMSEASEENPRFEFVLEDEFESDV